MFLKLYLGLETFSFGRGDGLCSYFVLLGWFPPCLLGLLLGPPFEAKLEWGFGWICLWVVLQHGRSSACRKGKVDSLKEYWLAWGTLVLHLVVEKSHSFERNDSLSPSKAGELGIRGLVLFNKALLCK